MTVLALTYSVTPLPLSRTERDRRELDLDYASARTREIDREQVQHWHQDAHARLIHLMSLSKGWDGDESPAVRPEIATFAWSALSSVMSSATPMPFIAPVSGGGLQIEWHSGGLDIELYIPQPSRAELYIEYQDGRESVEQDLTSDFERLCSAVQEISGRRPV